MSQVLSEVAAAAASFVEPVPPPHLPCSCCTWPSFCWPAECRARVAHRRGLPPQIPEKLSEPQRQSMSSATHYMRTRFSLLVCTGSCESLLPSGVQSALTVPSLSMSLRVVRFVLFVFLFDCVVSSLDAIAKSVFCRLPQSIVSCRHQYRL